LWLLLCLTTPFFSIAQLNADRTIYDMGILSVVSPYQRIALYNQTSQPIYLSHYEAGSGLRAEKLPEVIPPGQYAFLNVAILPGNRNRFEEQLDLFTHASNTPVRIALKGRFNRSKKQQDCPDFSSTKRKKPKHPKSRTAPKQVLVKLNNNTAEKLPEQLYKTNNLVLLIDASMSMNETTKKELLQTAFAELTQLLRPQDQLTVITYADEARIVIYPHEKANTGRLDSLFNALEIGGFTNASAGIRTACKWADSLYSKAYNNEIILATDGAFNTNETESISEDMATYAAHYDIRLSILGIQTKKWAEQEMKKLSSERNGRFIRVDTKKQAQTALKKTIKIHSKK
jgi:Mg-chelatase subunit ChlD